jgi:hypothetical protein
METILEASRVITSTELRLIRLFNQLRSIALFYVSNLNTEKGLRKTIPSPGKKRLATCTTSRFGSKNNFIQRIPFQVVVRRIGLLELLNKVVHFILGNKGDSTSAPPCT